MTAKGLHVPGYRVEVLLGAGASSDVWRARVRETGAEVALKRIRGADARTFEAKALAKVDHPNLIRVHGVIEIEDGVVLVLDFAGGGSLARLLAARGRLHAGEVVGALTPIASALAEVHSAGIVHADVSPSNILFSADGLPLLADLGLAHLVGAQAAGLTAVPYADPFTLPGEPSGYESDVYSLGAIAFHALTGERLARDLDLLDRLRSADVPLGMAEVVRSAVQADLRRRPSAATFALELRHSADAIRVELRAGRHAAPGAGAVLTRGARLPTPALPRTEPRPQRRARAGLRPLVVLAASLGLIGVAVANWSGSSVSHGAPTRAVLPVTAATSSRPTRHFPEPSPTTRHRQSLSEALSSLDRQRELAYAKRDPGLLAGVYSAVALRERDGLQLLRLVPAGCGLYGVRSTFGTPTVLTDGLRSITVRVPVRLAASTLICQGRRTATAPGAAMTMTITLTRSGSSYRIAAERTAP